MFVTQRVGPIVKDSKVLHWWCWCMVCTAVHWYNGALVVVVHGALQCNGIMVHRWWWCTAVHWWKCIMVHTSEERLCLL